MGRTAMALATSLTLAKSPGKPLPPPAAGGGPAGPAAISCQPTPEDPSPADCDRARARRNPQRDVEDLCEDGSRERARRRAADDPLIPARALRRFRVALLHERARNFHGRLGRGSV